MMVFCLGLLLALAGATTAAINTWTGGGADSLWTTSGNWDAPPSTGSLVYVDAVGNAPLINMDVADEYDNVYFGVDHSAEVVLSMQTGGYLRTDSLGKIAFGRLSGSNARAEMTGGTFSGHKVIAGSSGTGTINMSGGNITVDDWVGVGENAGGVGVLNMSGGAISANNMTAGHRGRGAIDISGGTVVAGNWVGIGRESTATGSSLVLRDSGSVQTHNVTIGLRGHGTFDMQGGTFALTGTDGHIRVGEDTAAGTWNISGGQSTVPDYVSLGYSPNSVGTNVMRVTGGDVTARQILCGQSGNGRVEISGSGKVTVTDWLGVGRISGSDGVLTLDGGELAPYKLTVALSGNGVFTMTDGLLNLTTNRGTDARIRIGESSGLGVWNMEGGTVYVPKQIVIGYGTSAGAADLMNMSGGEVYAGALIVGRNGDGTIELSGGTLNINYSGNVSEYSGADTLQFDTSTGDGQINLAGGVIQWMGGDYTAEAGAFAASGDIIAYGGTGTLNITYDSGSDTTLITANPVLYDQWTTDHELSGADAVASADPDGDDLNNLYEFGLGGDPMDSVDRGISPTYGRVEDSGTNWMDYVYPKRTDANSGIAYHLELCDDLVSNVWKNGDGFVVGTGPINPEFNAVTNRIPMVGKPEQFIRLLIEADDIVLADFDRRSYAGWITTGTAFGSEPATGTLPNQHEVTGFEGAGLVNSYLGRDASTGTLTSPEFTIQRKYVNFLVGGGNHEGQTCINLWVNGEIVRTQTGANDETLKWASWDVSDLIGQYAQIEIVDRSTESWGHINIDSLIQSDSPSVYEIELTVQAEKRYLNIPVDNSEGQERVLVSVDGAETDDYYFKLQLADPGEADFWVYMDLNRYAGHKIVLKTRRGSSQDIDALEQCYQSDEPREAATFYTEEKRPQFHFSSQRGWLNDANGPVYYNGIYHLFYQHNPYGWNWGNMHWGHATSTDLVHWVEQGDAIFPDELGTIYSGTAVVDEMNTSGFQSGADSPIVAFYTAAGDHAPEEVPRTQSISYSTDGGATFSKYAGNPIIENITPGNRDPKVFWYEPTGTWVMVLYLENSTFAFFNSSDLKTWTETSRLEFTAGRECPDLFPLPVDGDTNTVKWVFWAGNGSYSIGDFDGSTFTPAGDDQSLYADSNGYAAQTFNNIPSSEGRCIQISWMKNADLVFEGMPFNQQMTMPVDLTLNSTTNGLRLFAWPIAEIESLYATSQTFPSQGLTVSETNLLAGIESDAQDILAGFELVNSNATFGFEIRGSEFVYHADTQQVEVDGTFMDLVPVNGKINMRILIDTASVEFFAGDGQVYMPIYLAASETNGVMKIFTRDDSVILKTLEVNGLKSIWN